MFVVNKYLDGMLLLLLLSLLLMLLGMFDVSIFRPSNELSASFVSTKWVGNKHAQLLRANAKRIFFNFYIPLHHYLAVKFRKSIVLYDLTCTHHFQITFSGDSWTVLFQN